ncbi:MAG: hypothetical protein ACT4P2_10410 [Pseudomonadota bacterium]
MAADQAEGRELAAELATLERLKTDLEAHHLGKWVVILGDELVGTFDTFDNAAREATRRFGRGPYLIRKVGAPPVTLPPSLMFRPAHIPDAHR